MEVNVVSSTGYDSWPSFIMSSAFAITTYNNGVCNTIKQVSEGGRAYYGITWDESVIYHTRVLDTSDGYIECLVSLDSEYNELSSWAGNFSASHQICYHDGNVAIAQVESSSVALVNMEQALNTLDWTVDIDSAEHLNAVWRDNDSWWVNFNNHAISGRSKIVNVSDDFSTIIETIDIGNQVHNVARVGDLLYICSSGEGKLLVYSLSAKEIINVVEGLEWVRGLVITDEHIIVGAAVATADREFRLRACTEVHLIDQATLSIVDTLTFEGCGPVYELRGTGPVDLAHNGIRFPGAV